LRKVIGKEVTPMFPAWKKARIILFPEAGRNASGKGNTLMQWPGPMDLVNLDKEEAF
jgi:hypothetical protein